MKGPKRKYGKSTLFGLVFGVVLLFLSRELYKFLQSATKDSPGLIFIYLILFCMVLFGVSAILGSLHYLIKGDPEHRLEDNSS